MPWNWVNDLFSSEKKKSMDWESRCPYHLCPSNQPFRGAYKSRLKFVQKVCPMIYQYKCKDCGCLVNVSVEVPDERGIAGVEPALWGGKPSYK